MGKKKLDILKKNQINKKVNLALNWLTTSGIQNSDKRNKKQFGAFNAWFDTKSKKYSYMYSEITGYLITSMLFHYELTKKKIFLQSAKNCADWLIENSQDTSGGFKCLFLVNKKLKYGKKKNYIYAFDNGVIINGLVNLYNVTSNKKYLSAAEKSAEFMNTHFFKKNNQIKPVYDLKNKKFIEDAKEWSLVSGSYHTKISMGYFNLYKATKKKKYLVNGKKILDAYLKKQKKNGEFISTVTTTNYHPYCYSLEGYWACGEYLKNKNYKLSCIKGVKWILKNINTNGFPPRLRFKKKFNYYERIDILAQSLRIILLNKKNIKLQKLENMKLNLLIENILNNQKINKRNKKVNGGFIWGKKSNGEITNDVNTWVSSFASQSLSLLINNDTKKILKLNPFYLV